MPSLRTAAGSQPLTPPLVHPSHLLRRLEALPMLRVLLPFAAGILLSDRVLLPAWLLVAAFLLTGLLALLLRSQTALAAMLVAAGAGAAQRERYEPAVPTGTATFFDLRIEGIPAERGTYTRSDALVVAWRDPADGRWHGADDRLRLFADPALRLDPGERLVCHGAVRPFRDDSYGALMARRGYAGSLWLGERNLTERRPTASNDLHTAAVRRLERLPLRDDRAAVVRALCAGDRSGITPELRETYARSGFSHLLALSGLHTGILFLLVNALCWWMPLLRRGHLARNLVVVAALWTFVAAAGFPVSAVRAAVMCTMLQFARASGSTYVALNALATAAFGMLLWSPAWLGDVSFLLSFIAVAAILCWGVPLCRRWRTGRRWIDLPLHAWVIGVAATVATAPLVARTFGIMPLAGMATGPAAILLAGVVVACGVGWMVCPAGLLAPLVGGVAGGAATGIGMLAERTAALPGGVVEWRPDGALTAAIYALFIVGTLVAGCKEPRKPRLLPKKEVHLPL